MDSKSLLTPEQATALVREAAKGMTPPAPKAVALAKRLEPFRAALQEQRALGFGPKEMVIMLAKPNIGLNVSETLVRKFLNHSLGRKKRKKKPAPLNLEADQPKPAQ